MPSEEQCLQALSVYISPTIARLRCSILREHQEASETIRRSTRSCRRSATDGEAKNLSSKLSRLFNADSPALSADVGHGTEVKYCCEHKQTQPQNLEPLPAELGQGHKANRGHDSDAVQILEQAFQHTPNITQAEKYRLAEVTGLQPKQVTIWVSFFFSIDASRYFAPPQHARTRPNGDEGQMPSVTIGVVVTYIRPH